MKTIRKIICPTDFSVAANNAIEYASNLAQKMNVEIELLHIQQIPLLDAFNVDEVTDTIEDVKDLLQNMVDEIYANYDVVCSYSVEVSLARLEKIITSKSMGQNLIVMGTNGIDSLYQYIFGTNAYHVGKRSECPVLIIPEKVIFKDLKKMVFTWDYSRENRISFLQLKDFMELFTPQITFLHVSKNKSKAADDVYDSFQTDLFSYFGDKSSIHFARVYNEGVDSLAEKINQFANSLEMDLVIMTSYEKGIFEDLFHENVLKMMSEEANFPLLILHV
jgi:nucleotide-binding universal stress UspA family protein